MLDDGGHSAQRPTDPPAPPLMSTVRVKMVSEAQETHAAFSHLFLSVYIQGAASIVQ